MADPFSIIGLVDTAFSTCVALYEFFSAVAEAPEEIKHLLRQLEEFKKLFPLIKDYAHGISQAPRSEGNVLAQEALLPMLRCCETDFNSIHAAVKGRNPENLSALRRLGKEISWVLGQEQIQAFTKRLDAAKVNLCLALQVSGGHTDLWVLEQLGQLVTQQETLRAELQRGFQTFVPQLLKSLDIHENRLNKINTESQVHLDYLSKSMSDPFHSFPNARNAAEKSDSEESGAAEKSDSKESGTAEKSDSEKSSTADNLLGSKPDNILPPSFNLPVTAREDYTQENKPAVLDNKVDVNYEPHEPEEPARLFQDSPYPSFSLPRSKTFNEGDYTELAEALDRFKKNWSTDRQQTPSSTSWSGLKEIMNEAEKSWSAGATRSKSSRMQSRIYSGLDAWKDMLPGDSSAALIGGFSILLQAASKTDMYEGMSDGLAEMSDALRLCQREFELQPVPEIGTAMTKLYVSVLDYAGEASTILSRSTWRRVIDSSTPQESPIAKLLAKIRKQTDTVMREVEYQQRREIRQQGREMREMGTVMQRMNSKIHEMHEMVRNIQLDQQRIMAGIDSQRAILESLQDQQNLMSIIKTQQEILRGVQQLLLRLSE